MASGDFTELSERAARAARFDPTDATDLTRANEAVNQAYLAACTRDGIQFDFLEQEGRWSTASGSDTYTYASIATAIGVTGASIAEILWLVNDSDGSVLDSMAWADLEKMSYSTQDGDADGEPVYWAKWGNRIRVYPTPDATYTVGALVRLAPTEMTSGSDTPLIPIAYRHSVIVSYAAAVLLRMEGGMEAHQEAQFYQRQYEDAWVAMRTAHATARKPTFNLRAPGWDSEHRSFIRDDPYGWAS